MSQPASDSIAAYNAGRDAPRLALKMAGMRSNAAVFFRGAAHLFWQRVRETGVRATAPAAWCCGDLHLENVGAYRGDNGLAYFDLNDFDEAALAPCDWEMLRFLTSILVTAPLLGLSKPEARKLAEMAAEAYRCELARGKPRWIERRTATGAIDALMTELKKRTQVRLLNHRTFQRKGERRLDLASPRIWAITDAERQQLSQFAAALGKARNAKDYFRFIDGAGRVAGMGSLGLKRYVLLIQGEGSPDGNVLLDLKLAQTSSLIAASPLAQPPWPDDAHRIVTIQQWCEAIPPGQLSAQTFGGQPYVLKDLQPMADRLNLVKVAADAQALSDALQTMAQLAAWAQLRSAGRAGAASADDLVAFARSDAGLAKTLVDTARDLAAMTQTDYKQFCDTQTAESARKVSPATVAEVTGEKKTGLPVKSGLPVK